MAWPLPPIPTTIALYVSALAQAGRKVAAIEHRLAALWRRWSPPSCSGWSG